MFSKIPSFLARCVSGKFLTIASMCSGRFNIRELTAGKRGSGMDSGMIVPATGGSGIVNPTPRGGMIMSSFMVSLHFKYHALRGNLLAKIVSRSFRQIIEERQSEISFNLGECINALHEFFRRYNLSCEFFRFGNGVVALNSQFGDFANESVQFFM